MFLRSVWKAGGVWHRLQRAVRDGRREPLCPGHPRCARKPRPAQLEQRSARCPGPGQRHCPGCVALGSALGWAQLWARLCPEPQPRKDLVVLAGKCSSVCPRVSLTSATGRAIAEITPAERGHLKRGFYKVNWSPRSSPK